MPFDVASYILGQKSGGGGDITVESLSVTQNGTYEETGKAYSPVVVDVPNTYSAADEGKVVSNGALVSQTAHAEVTSNGTINTTLNNSVVVNVSGKSGSITFSENTNFDNYTLDVGGSFDFFAIYATANPLNIVGGRTFSGLFKNFTTNTGLAGIYMMSNAGGTVYGGTLDVMSHATKSGSVITFHATDNPKFASGITYQWYAW